MSRSGVRFPSPAQNRLGGTPAEKRISPTVAARVLRTYQSEGSYAGAARRLNELGAPTVIEDARWHPTTVAKVVQRSQA